MDRRSFLIGSTLAAAPLALPALAAARCNPDLKAVHDRHRAAGKPPKLALTAVMRKLLLLANALVRDNRTWTTAKPA